jgi:transposase-like protein
VVLLIVPICPICGHEMYFAGNYIHFSGTVEMKRYMCVHCDHVEDMICNEKEDQEFVG